MLSDDWATQTWGRSHEPVSSAITPSPARLYDYYLGGKDNFAADRAAAEKIRAVFPALIRNTQNYALLAGINSATEDACWSGKTETCFLTFWSWTTRNVTERSALRAQRRRRARPPQSGQLAEFEPVGSLRCMRSLGGESPCVHRAPILPRAAPPSPARQGILP